MNKQIKQFERESGIDVYALGLDKVKWESRLEKFAELIVRECSNWIVENAGAMEHLGPEYFAKAMNEHFGVEE